MLISDLAVNATDQELFDLLFFAHSHGYYVHEEFINEFDNRAEQHTCNPAYDFFDLRKGWLDSLSQLCANAAADSMMRQFVAIDYAKCEERVTASEIREANENRTGSHTVTGRFIQNQDTLIQIKADPVLLTNTP